MPDLSLRLEVIQRGEEVVVLRDRLNTWVVQLVEVDAVAAEPREALLACLADNLRRPILLAFARPRRLAGACVEIVADLCGDGDRVPVPADSLAENGLTFAVSIDIRRVVK